MNTASIKSNTSEFCGIGEASRLLGISAQTIRRMNGELCTYVTAGGTRRFKRSDILNYVNGGEG
jgi:excisionase family DNA binding protein